MLSSSSTSSTFFSSIGPASLRLSRCRQHRKSGPLASPAAIWPPPPDQQEPPQSQAHGPDHRNGPIPSPSPVPATVQINTDRQDARLELNHCLGFPRYLRPKYASFAARYKSRASRTAIPRPFQSPQRPRAARQWSARPNYIPTRSQSRSSPHLPPPA